ncbi:hypothetical protein LSH36_2368g00003, partial [Paralvinella palmiformis]
MMSPKWYPSKCDGSDGQPRSTISHQSKTMLDIINSFVAISHEVQMA